MPTKHLFEFEYIDNFGNHLRAKLSPCHFPSTPLTNSGTDDPQWFVFPVLGVWGGPYPDLKYRGTNGGSWKTEIHAQYDGASHLTKIWVKSRDINDNNENGTFQIVDHQGLKWDMRIDNPIGNDTAPGFTMTQV